MQHIQYPGHLISRTGHRIQVVLQPQRLQFGSIGRLVGERGDVALLRNIEGFARTQRVHVIRSRDKIHIADTFFPNDDQSAALRRIVLVLKFCGVNISIIEECFSVVPFHTGNDVVVDVAPEPELSIGI